MPAHVLYLFLVGLWLVFESGSLMRILNLFPVGVRLVLENRGGPGRNVKSVRPVLYPHGWKHKPSKVRTGALRLIKAIVIPLFTVNDRSFAEVR